MDRVREKEGERHPSLFLVFQLSRGLIVLFYAIHRMDPVFILAYLPGNFIYLRNLYFIHKKKKRFTPVGSIEKRGCYGRQDDILAEEGPKDSAFYRGLFIGDLCETPIPGDLDRDDFDLSGGRPFASGQQVIFKKTRF